MKYIIPRTNVGLGGFVTLNNIRYHTPSWTVVEEDTTFDELSPTDGTGGSCVGDASNEKGAGSTSTFNGTGASGGQIINAAGDSNLTVFPKGATIFGRWDSFTIDADADGGVIAYLGY